jgi:hypothetical protein
MAVASRLHVLLRRRINRITDIVWMTANAEYAREVLRLARAERDEELEALVMRYEALVPSASPDPEGDARRAREREAGAKPGHDYIGKLR